MSNTAFIKRIKSDEIRKLKREYPSAFLLLDTIADNAKRKVGEGHPLLELGEAIITAEECGITKNQLPTAIIVLESKGLIEVIHRGRKDKNSKLAKRTRIKPESKPDSMGIKTGINGTIIKLLNSEYYDINIEIDQNQIQNQTRIKTRFNQHKEELRIKNKEEGHHPNPSSNSNSDLTDDLSSKVSKSNASKSNLRVRNLKSEQMPVSVPQDSISPAQITDHHSDTDFHQAVVNQDFQPKNQHNHSYQTHKSKKIIPLPKIEIVPGIFLSQEELNQCIEIKGSFESVQHAIGYIQAKPAKKYIINNWPNALEAWTIKDDVKTKLIKHEEMALRLSKEYSDFTNGWYCKLHHDTIKDVKGLVFIPQNAYAEAYFIPYIDKEFVEKASKFVRDKKMQKGRIS